MSRWYRPIAACYVTNANDSTWTDTCQSGYSRLDARPDPDLCPDDMIRLFNDWLDTYHEAHFKVIREIYLNSGSTRYDIWSSVSGAFPREDSAEADLFKLLIRDLSTGGVVRQSRETTYDGQFVKQRTKGGKRSTASGTLESAFEDTKPYVLTELGSQFVHYTMNEVVTRIGSGA